MASNPPRPNPNNNNVPKKSALDDIFGKLVNTGKLVPEPMMVSPESIKGTPGDFALSFLYQAIGEQGIRHIIQTDPTPKYLLGRLVNCVELLRRVNTVKGSTLEKVKALSSLPDDVRKTGSDFFMHTRVPVTPFNLHSQVLACPYAKLVAVNGAVFNFSVGGSIVEINYFSKEEFYKTAKIFFGFANRNSSRTEWMFQPFNDFHKKLTLAVATRVRLVEIDNGYALEYIDAEQRPKFASSDISLDTRIFPVLDELAKAVAQRLTLDHWYINPHDLLNVLYCNIVGKSHLHDEIVYWADIYKQIMESGEVNIGKYMFEPSPEQIKEDFESMARGIDPTFMDAKEMLQRSRAVRAKPNNKKVNAFTHDMAQMNRIAHLSESQWGALARLMVIMHASRYYSTEPRVLYCFGGGADEVVLSVLKGAEFGLFTKTYKPQLYYQGQMDRQAAVEGAIPGKPRELNHGDIYMVTSQDQENPAPFLSQLQELARKFPPGKPGEHERPWSLIVEHNLCSGAIFNSVISWCRDNDYSCRTFNHPRHHNDSYMWLITNSGFNDSDAANCHRDRTVMKYRILNNNVWRNNVMLCGWFDEPETYDESTSRLISTSIFVSQHRKTVSRKAKQAEMENPDFLASVLLNAVRGDNRPSHMPGFNPGGDGDNNNNRRPPGGPSETETIVPRLRSVIVDPNAQPDRDAPMPQVEKSGERGTAKGTRSKSPRTGTAETMKE